jgi:hypothetical protein
MINVSGGLNRGAGGYSGTGAVSTTASKEIADVLQNDMRIFASIKNFETNEDVLDFFLDIARKDNLSDERLALMSGRAANHSGTPADLGKELFNMWSYDRSAFGGPRPTLIIGDPMSDYWRTVNPEDIQTITIPKSSIPEDALVSNYDLGNSRGLEEIQVYADIPLSRAADVGRAIPDVPKYSLDASVDPATRVRNYRRSVADVEMDELPSVIRSDLEAGNVRLFHSTNSRNIDSIIQEGLRASQPRFGGQIVPGRFVYGSSSPVGLETYGDAIVEYSIPRSGIFGSEFSDFVSDSVNPERIAAIHRVGPDGSIVETIRVNESLGNVVEGAADVGRVEIPRGKWTEIQTAEELPTDFVAQFAEFDRAARPLGTSVDDLARSISERGFDDALILEVDPTGRAVLVEGNHRLAAAAALGLDNVPVRVVTSRSGALAGRGAPADVAEGLGSGSLLKPSDTFSEMSR